MKNLEEEEDQLVGEDLESGTRTEKRRVRKKKKVEIRRRRGRREEETGKADGEPRMRKKIRESRTEKVVRQMDKGTEMMEV